jgi:predicted permease
VSSGIEAAPLRDSQRRRTIRQGPAEAPFASSRKCWLEVSAMSLWSRAANVFRAGRVERELDEELQFHIDERVRELTAAGMTREAAARAVRRRFGSPLRLRERNRDVKLLPWLESMVRDVQLGARTLRKNPVVTGAAVMSLSLALGACVAAFSLLDALILRPLPVRHPEQLVYLAFPTYTSEQPEADTFNDPLFLRLRDASRGLIDLFAMSTQVIRPAIFPDAGGEKERLRTQYISGDTFDRLGIRAAAGRLLARHDDTEPGASPLAVLSHAFWMRRFGGDPAILGRWFTLEDRQFRIIGVAEPRFIGVEPGRPTDLWLPYAMYNPRAFGNAAFGWFRIMGRMRENVRLEQAESVLRAAFTSFRRDYSPRLLEPAVSPESVKRFVDTPLYVRSAANGPSPLRRQFERPLWILASIAALILLIAGSNVANLFLARAAAREREMSLRLSIGAGRSRLLQQLLVESAIVGCAACVLGLVFAGVAAPAVVGMLTSADDPVHLDLRLGWRLVAFIGTVSLLITALFGLAPAMRVSSVAPVTALKAGGERSGARTGVMRPFIALQVAFSVAVLFVGDLLVLSFARLSRVDPGFATSDVLSVSLETVTRLDADQRRTALFRVLDRLGHVPGVQAASAAEFNMLGRAWTLNVRVPGTQHETIESTMAPVTSGFFETMRVPLLAGRTFAPRDMKTENPTAIIVNESFARRYFGGENAIGRALEGQFGDDAVQHVVVGVVADTKYDLRKPAVPTLYIPLPLRFNGIVHVRVEGDPAALASRLREETRAASPLFRVTSVTPVSAAGARTLLRERLLASLSGFFALVGLVLAGVGLYGVLSYSVVQRTREIGVRIALGARQLGAVRSVMADASGATLIGGGFGVAGGFYLSRFVETLLFEVKPLDFWSLALPLGTLLVAAILAAAIPALRVARLDPVVALRHE